VADDDAAPVEEILNVPEAETEPMVEPGRVGDHLARVAVTSVRIRRLHPQIIFAGSDARQLDSTDERTASHTSRLCIGRLLPTAVNLTMPTPAIRRV
jgi:hypothetical protein